MFLGPVADWFISTGRGRGGLPRRWELSSAIIAVLCGSVFRVTGLDGLGPLGTDSGVASSSIFLLSVEEFLLLE